MGVSDGTGVCVSVGVAGINVSVGMITSVGGRNVGVMVGMRVGSGVGAGRFNLMKTRFSA